MRVCRECGVSKSSDAYYTDARVKSDGRRARCIDCMTKGVPCGPVPIPILDRYRTDENGCWIWDQGSTSGNGGSGMREQQEIFDGQEIVGYVAAIPAMKLEAPDSYQRGTYLTLQVEVRVRSVRYEEVTSGKQKGELIKVHVL